MGVTTLNVRFTDAEYEELREAKGNRTWEQAIKEEFGLIERDD